MSTIIHFLTKNTLSLEFDGKIIAYSNTDKNREYLKRNLPEGILNEIFVVWGEKATAFYDEQE